MGFNVSHGIFFLGILAYFGNPCATCLYVIVVDLFGCGFGNFVHVVVIAYHVIGPRPLIVAIMAVDFLKSVDDVLNRLNISLLDVVA